LNNLDSLGVIINIFGCWKGNPRPELLAYFEDRHIHVVTNYAENPDELECKVPFDIVEKIAKIPNWVRLNATLVRLGFVGSVTSQGDTVLNTTWVAESHRDLALSGPGVR
jgi:hypothetical protein